MKFSEFPYTRPDLPKLLAEYEDLTARLRAASAPEEQISIYQEQEALAGHFQTMNSICEIRSTVDTRDAFYEKEKEFFDENIPLVNEKSMEFSKAMLDSPFRGELEKKLGSLLFRNMELEVKSFSPEIIPLMQEENKLASQYQKLYASAQVEFMGEPRTIAQLAAFKQDPDRSVRKAAYEAEGGFFDQHREEFDSIFDQLVKNRTEQARRMGYQNFVELGYIRQQRNCYGPKEVAVFRRQVLRDLVPIVREIKAVQEKRIGVDALKFYDDVYCFPDGNPMPQGTPEELLAAGKKMYTELSPETAEFIKLMFDMDLFDVLAKKGKAPGGYCTFIMDYHCPFIFSNFNGTAGDVDVLTHEAGHAFAFYMSDRLIERIALRCPTMEGAETHSMSMEFMTAPWHHLFFKDQTDKYELSHGEDALIFIPYGTQVDHFQELVYSNPDMTPQERNDTWMELDRQYRPYIDYADLPFYGRGAGWQRQLHIYLNPFYYLEYCLAGTAAAEFWALSMEDWKKAWERYLAFVKLGGTMTFTDLLKEVGMKSPLEEGCLKEICAPIQSWLAAHQL